jgi:hypothetical protein
MPSAVEGAVTVAPKIGAADAGSGAVAAAQPPQPRREEKVASAAPGFSFK